MRETVRKPQSPVYGPLPSPAEAVKFDCLTCGAAPGEWCTVRISGRRATFLHSNRFFSARWKSLPA